MPIRLGELAARFGCELIGDPDVKVERVAALGNAGPGSLTFLSASGFRPQLATTRAAAVILRPDDADACPVAALVTDNPYATYARMAAVLHPPAGFAPGVHPTAVVSPSAQIAVTAHIGANAVVEDDVRIGEDTVIGPGCIVGAGSAIGDACRLHASVTFVRQVTTGDRCIFHSGSVVGADGFGQALAPDGWIRVPQIGGVRIGNDVEVGACTTIDCGAIDDTVIGDGVRLDNQIQIGHNVQVGEHTAMASGVAIAGSATIGKRCMLAGMVGVAGHISICDDVVVNGKTMVSKSITEPGTYASMFAVEPVAEWNRTVARVRRLGKLTDRVSKLEKGGK